MKTNVKWFTIYFQCQCCAWNLALSRKYVNIWYRKIFISIKTNNSNISISGLHDQFPRIPPKKTFKSLPYLAKFYLHIIDISVASLLFLSNTLRTISTPIDLLLLIRIIPSITNPISFSFIIFLQMLQFFILNINTYFWWKTWWIVSMFTLLLFYSDVIMSFLKLWLTFLLLW